MKVCDVCGKAKLHFEMNSATFLCKGEGNADFADEYDICDSCAFDARKSVLAALTKIRDVALIDACPSLTADQRDKVMAWKATTEAAKAVQK